MKTFQRAKVVPGASIHHETDKDGIVDTDPAAKLVFGVKCIYNLLKGKCYEGN